LLLLLLQTGDNSLTVSELPVRTWTQAYKEFLESLLKGADKDKDKEKGAAAVRKKKAAGDEEGGG
jgi:DNA topoisomerase-2